MPDGSWDNWIDRKVYYWFQDHGNPWVLYSCRDFTALGGTTLVPLVALCFGSCRLCLCLALAASANTVLKYLFNRTRPPGPSELLRGASFPIPETPSFPSGHSVASAVLYFGLAWERGLWLLLAVPPLVWATRVILSAHWLTDVIAGAILGGAFCGMWLWFANS